MRLTPAQMGVLLICGQETPMGPQHSFPERIKCGREILTSITGIDYEYDLQRWHDHLKESGEGGYTWRRNIKLPKVMAAALAAEEWQTAIAELRKCPY